MGHDRRAAIYCRISRDRAGAGIGVENQERECRALAERRGYPVAAVFADNDLSAYSGKPRPGYKAVLAAIGAGQIDVLIAWHTDRLHRSPRELEDFIALIDRHSVAVETVTAGLLDLSTASGRMNARIVGAVARGESEHKSERAQLKQDQLARNGRWAGGARAYGYRVVIGAGLEIQPAEAEIVREAAARVVNGESLLTICGDLNARGVAPALGQRWTTRSLKQILVSGRIAGMRVHHGEIVGPATWDAIITHVQGERLRSILTSNGHSRGRRPKTLLVGLLYCVNGHRMLSRGSSRGSSAYGCKRGPDHGGCGISTFAAPLERWVREAVLAALDTPALAATVTETPRNEDDAYGLAEDRALLDRLAELTARKEITEREWLRQRAIVAARIEAAERKMATRTRDAPLTTYAGRSGVLRERWGMLTTDQQRAVLASVIDRVVIASGQRIKGWKPDRVSIIWRF